jgi:DNA excision repair protein ERCC-2
VFLCARLLSLLRHSEADWSISQIRNYGALVVELSSAVPDGIVCFFPSYGYMESLISQWNDMGLVKQMLRNKLLFIETTDSLESSIAVAHYRYLVVPFFAAG